VLAEGVPVLTPPPPSPLRERGALACGVPTTSPPLSAGCKGLYRCAPTLFILAECSAACPGALCNHLQPEIYNLKSTISNGRRPGLRAYPSAEHIRALFGLTAHPARG